jgi:hypothetical protein
MVGFDNGTEIARILDGFSVAQITPELASTIDLTRASMLAENTNLAFMGVTPAGPFDISKDEARRMLSATNSSLRPNSDVVRPSYNALDITRRARDIWTIDFGTEMSEAEAALYEEPFKYVKEMVRPAVSKVDNLREKKIAGGCTLDHALR